MGRVRVARGEFQLGEEKRCRSILLEICDYVELQVRIKDTTGFILHELSNNLQSFEKTRKKTKKKRLVMCSGKLFFVSFFFLVAVGCMIFFHLSSVLLDIAVGSIRIFSVLL